MKIEQEMGGSRLIVSVDPLPDKFSDKDAEKSQRGIQIGYGTRVRRDQVFSVTVTSRSRRLDYSHGHGHGDHGS